MGCDIHLFVEKKRGGLFVNDSWYDILKPYGPRDYLLFGHLSYGVRTTPESGYFHARGLPENISHETFRYFHVPIVADEEEKKRQDWHWTVTQDEAVDMEKYGSRRVSRYNSEYMTHPDYHSMSWLSSEEFFQAVRNTVRARAAYYEKERSESLQKLLEFKNNTQAAADNLNDVLLEVLTVSAVQENIATEYLSIVNYIISVELHGDECRVVFGFDN